MPSMLEPNNEKNEKEKKDMGGWCKSGALAMPPNNTVHAIPRTPCKDVNIGQGGKRPAWRMAAIMIEDRLTVIPQRI